MKSVGSASGTTLDLTGAYMDDFHDRKNEHSLAVRGRHLINGTNLI